jgi:hypothetical protein
MQYNKLFLTFTQPDQLEPILARISQEYHLPYKKIWVLNSPDTTELLLTYNVSHTDRVMLTDTVMIHRQRLTNSIYTVNGLNLLVESLTGTKDPHYKIDWNNYRHKYIGSNNGKLRILHTQLKEIVEY